MFKKFICGIFALTSGMATFLLGTPSLNQTTELTPILPGDTLPFIIQLSVADFSLPNGIHSYAEAVYDGKWLFIAGRTNGMHDFSSGDNNFPPAAQNKVVYVVDPQTKTIFSRSLVDPSSGLTVKQIDSLSVTSPQFYRSNGTLYISGGYGVDTETGEFSTKDTLTAIDILGLMHWVMEPSSPETAAQSIRQIFNPVFQITGGYMTQIENHPTLLVFGQNFKGYYHPDSNGAYSKQIYRFHIVDDGVKLDVKVLTSIPDEQESYYRRRDLNVVPVIHFHHGRYREKLIAYSGVFTMEGGIWTVPVVINSKGKPKMQSPYIPESFKQGMNNYTCPNIGLFSKESSEMYTVFMGGISYGYFVGNEFETDSEIPFINQLTTVKYDKDGHFTQYLMNEEYPVILSTHSNPGNVLLFGAGAQFILAEGNPIYAKGILNLDALTEPTVIGFVVGGIQSTVPNTSVPTDSAASPYIFQVTIMPNN